jgi:hypothetical protein
MLSSLTNFTLAPFAMFFRISYAHPVIAIVVSTMAGILAYATGHENWMALLVSFGAYILIWWDESEHRAAAGTAPEAAD